jgi:hypothetical protein
MNSGPNWARRYGPTRRRLCARPGCGAPAAATLRFQPTQREAWLVDLDADAARTEGDLCARHAAGLVLPRGWQLHDALTTRLAVPPPPEAPAAASSPRTRGAAVGRSRRRRGVNAADELPGLSAVNADEHPEPNASHEQRSGNQPRSPLAAATSAANEALASTLDVRTPLLRRAFSNVWLPDAHPVRDAEDLARDDTG